MKESKEFKYFKLIWKDRKKQVEEKEFKRLKDWETWKQNKDLQHFKFLNIYVLCNAPTQIAPVTPFVIGPPFHCRWFPITARSPINSMMSKITFWIHPTFPPIGTPSYHRQPDSGPTFTSSWTLNDIANLNDLNVE